MVLAAGTVGDNFIEYLIPIITIIVYFFMTARKKKAEPASYEEMEAEEETLAPLPPAQPKKIERSDRHDLPPVQRNRAALQSSIEQRNMGSSINTRDFSSGITEKYSLVSTEMLQHIDHDPAYAHKVQIYSRARKLLANKSTLREAFLLKEILNRPYE